MGHAQGIGIVLCYLPNRPIMYLVGPVYSFTVQLSNTTSMGNLKFYLGSQKVMSEPLKNYAFWTLKVVLRSHPTRLRTIWTIFK